MAKVIPKHIEGLLSYLNQPHEKANEDLVLQYFRHVYGKAFSRQSDAGRSDGYVAGHFVLELKGKSSDWLAGLFQGLAYKAKELHFSLIVVAAENFLSIWKAEDIPENICEEVLTDKRAPNAIGKAFAKKYAKQKNELLKKAIWNGTDSFGELFNSQSEVIIPKIQSFEKTLSQSRKIRQPITLKNFTSVLKELRGYFDPAQPIKAVRAFYSMLYGWNDASTVQISNRVNDQATVGGETVSCLIPGKRFRFKKFVEDHAISLQEEENEDDFFARFDMAIDAVDPQFRIKHGIFFTDLMLSKFVMWFVKKHIPNLGKNYLVIDPACGSGNLVTNWRSPLELRHKVVSEIEPELLFAVEQRMKGDQWHNGKFTVVPKVSEGRGLNFLDKSAAEYLAVVKRYLEEKGQKADKPIAFLCNPPYRNDDDQSASGVSYQVHPSIMELTRKASATERYCCFLAQMKLICEQVKDSGLPEDTLLLIFTETSWLNRTSFKNIRREITSCFEDVGGLIVNSKEFFKVKGKFPIAFTIWRYRGRDAGLNAERAIPLLDLTWLTKNQMSELSWDNQTLLDKQCGTIIENEKSVEVNFDPNIFTLREWSGLSRKDFMRARKNGNSGLPLGDHRESKRSEYGDAFGQNIGFMGDLTPVRISLDVMGAPGFRLDSSFMDHKRARCLSGLPDHVGFYPEDQDSIKKCFFWYSLARTFKQYKYPMWVHNCELWAPPIPKKLENDIYKLSYAIAFAENECVETTFPANNPAKGCPELRIFNPMTPLNPHSFWSSKLAINFKNGGRSIADRLVGETSKVYTAWTKHIGSRKEIAAPFKKPYFINDGVLTIGSGLIQIREYAKAVDNQELLKTYDGMQDILKEAKDEFHKILNAKEGLNYFAINQDSTVHEKKTPELFSPVTKFDYVVEKRLAVASVIVQELADDPNFGRTKFVKLFYLADVAQELDMKTEYYREAAGPLDARALYNAQIGIESLSNRYGYFNAEKSDKKINYYPGENINKMVKRAGMLFGKKIAKIKKLIKLFEKLKTDQCEIIATLYACWNDLLLDDHEISDDKVIGEFIGKWHFKKKRFPKARLKKALSWMRENEMVPNGKGKHTCEKQMKSLKHTSNIFGGYLI